MKLDKLHTLLFAVALFAIPMGASAQSSGSSSQSSQSSQRSQQAASISGTIQNVDQKANTLQVKSTSAQLKDLKAGDDVHLMLSSGPATGIRGNVVRVSGDTVTISTLDLSGLQNGQQVALMSGSESGNVQGLGSPQSGTSGTSMTGSSTSGTSAQPGSSSTGGSSPSSSGASSSSAPEGSAH